MCGIVGIVDYKKNSSKELLQKMTDTLSHRGGDDSGYEFFEEEKYQLGFGHRRLSIQDLSALGHQPMCYEHLSIIYNGEVYNFKEIRDELEGLGYGFISGSDTEVILKAFHKWGRACVDRFRGMFVFSIYDKEANKIYIFRDRAGVKPLYYYHKDGLFLYASELKALLLHPQFIKKIDKKALSLYLQLGYIQAPFSIFEDNHKLLPAHYLEFDISSREYKMIKYWDIVDFYKQEKLDIPYDKAKKKLEELLIEAFSLRMVSDVKVGTFLSGGIDSSLVTAILSRHTDEKINTFSIGFEDRSYDEAPYAKKIANYLGVEHREYYCNSNDTLEMIERLPRVYDEPFGDSSAIPTMLVSKVAKRDISVALSGDGGDELFAGYSSYELFLKRDRFLDKLYPYRAIFERLDDPYHLFYRLNYRYYMKYLKVKNSLSYSDISNRFKVSNSIFSACEIKSVLREYHFLSDEVEDGISRLELMMIGDFKGYLADDILHKVDRASMSYSLESREPFLDHKLIEFVATLPISYKENKKILKDILSNYIPKELFERKKSGFGIPINRLLRGELRYLLDRYLSRERLSSYALFDVEYILRLKELFLEKKIDDRKIWLLVVFSMWYEENMRERV